MIDSHCHLADQKFKDDLDEVLHRARAADIHTMIAIADTLQEAEDCLALAEKYEQIYCTSGVHPHTSREWTEDCRQKIEGLVKNNAKVVAIGEIGLDYHYMNSPKEVQQNVFRQQLEIAKELNMPAVIHNRESITDLKQIIDEVQPPRFVIHCCTEEWEDVADLVEQGHFLSFTGIATYPKSDAIRRTIAHCPLEQLIIETDAPYLAPVPHRGKRNEPAFVVEVAKCVAEVKHVSFEEIDEITTRNTVEFFGLS